MEPKFEAIELEGNSAINVRHFECSRFQDNHNWHYHPQCEITYVIKGRGSRFVGDDLQRFGPGDIVFLGPNIPHCWVNDGDAAIQDECNELIVVQFMPDFMGDEFSGLPDMASLLDFYRRASRGVSVNNNVSPRVSSLLIELEQSSGIERIILLLNIFSALSKNENTQQLASSLYRFDAAEFHSGRMEKIVNYTKEHLGTEIKQTDVAELVGMTPPGFSRFFRATAGRTFVSFINVMRIMEACRRLVSSEADIIDIAFECGYSNLSNFNRRFMELKKQTPSQYRRQYCQHIQT